MREKVIKYIEENKLLEKKDKVLVALSGGPDSVCLLHMLYTLRDIYEFELGAVHINHMLRGEESDGDEEYVEKLCDNLGIKCYVKRIDIDYIAEEQKISLEVAGRQERYKVFEELKKQYGYNKVAVAHNANDQAETILMRLMRGTGLEGLTGIKAIRDGNIIRPILCLNRDEIEKYCESNKLYPRIDSSNKEKVYSRNKVRLDILPYMRENFNDDIIDSLNRMALLLQKDNEFIEEYSNKCYNVYCEEGCNGLVISKELFIKEKEAIVTRVIKKSFKKISKSYQNFEMKHIYDIATLTQKSSGKMINLTNNIIAQNIYGDIILKVKKSDNIVNEAIEVNIDSDFMVLEYGKYKIKFEKNVNKADFSKNNLIKLFDYDKIDKEIIIRNRNDGDKIVPLGMKGSKKLKDIFIDLKVPRDERKDIPIVAIGERIAWVVGCKTSDEFKITKDTKNILKITFMRKD